MRIASSLTNRIFLACTVLATLTLGFAFYFVNARASREAELELRRGLTEAGMLFDEQRATLTDTVTRHARLIADLPKLKGAIDTGDPPTVQPLVEDYRQQIDADLLAITYSDGTILGTAGDTGAALPAIAAVTGSTAELSAFELHPRGVLQVVSVPVLVIGAGTEILGRLTVGVLMDDRLAARFKALTGSEIAFGAGGRIRAASLPSDLRSRLVPALDANDITSVTLGATEYLALARPLHLDGESSAAAAASPVTLIMRSRTEQLRFLSTVRAGLAGALVLTVVLATVLSYAVARTVTRPLAAVTGAMREVAATGDLTRKVLVRSRPWDDEDARLLAAAFNTLTESIARFQRDAAQKERLSSLGRLSTVIAHEIRNPLMIIRASLATLRRGDVSPSEMREAVVDIDEETTRLNRIVTEVLDFAKPLRFNLTEANLNEICRASAAAAWAGAPDEDVRLDLQPDLPELTTDRERLRTALVNILANARHAVQALSPAGDASAIAAVRSADPAVVVRTREHGDHVSIAVEDRGVGIAADDVAHIFDPYFTTRRAGTGLGLPIAKNIIEGLGGRIAVTSRRGEGTEIRIDLPLTPPEVAA